MKKFLFSAVALIAFSFSSMASNEVKEDFSGLEEKTEITEKEENALMKNKSDEYGDFAVAAVAALEWLTGVPIEDCDEYEDATNGFYNYCMQN